MINYEISIIIPVFDAAKTLHKCVESVVCQVFSNWELILVDDGSNDDSVSICKQYAGIDNRIVVLQQKHQGVSAARNLALSKAKGKYVCFIDSDDYVEPDYLAQLLTHQDYDMVICGYYVDVYKDKALLKREQHSPEVINIPNIEKRDDLLPLFMSGMIHINCNKLLKMDIIRKHGLQYEPQPVNEDYMFMLSYLRHAHSITTVTNPLYHWVRIEGNKSGVDSMPDNLLELYNKAHIETRSYFGNNKTADLSLYYSYSYLILKYIIAYQEGQISKEEIKTRMKEFHINSLVRASYAAYQPKNKGEWLMHNLQKQGYFSLYRWLRKHLI
jgi:glycosyltransferase involved in cell wall biosynthesis